MAININNTNAGTFTLTPPATGGGITLTLPATAGSNGQGLATDASGNLSFYAPVLTGFTTVINNTGSNATTFVTSITASGGTTNQDFALVQKSAASPLLMLAVPDGTATGGNARGPNSIDLALGKTNASSIAAGTNSIIIGGSSLGTASTSYNVILIGGTMISGLTIQNPDTYGITVAIGVNNFQRIGQTYGATSDQGWLLACAATVLDATSLPNQGAYNIVGPSSRAIPTSSFSHVFNSTLINTTDFNSNAARRVLLYARTTTATTRQMTTDGAAATGTALTSIMFNNTNTAGILDIKVVATQELASGTVDSACWQIQGLFYKDGTAASSVINQSLNSKTFSSAGASTWAAALVADTTTGFPAINVTGATGVTIRWMAYVLMAEVKAYD